MQLWIAHPVSRPLRQSRHEDILLAAVRASRRWTPEINSPHGYERALGLESGATAPAYKSARPIRYAGQDHHRVVAEPVAHSLVARTFHAAGINLRALGSGRQAVALDFIVRHIVAHGLRAFVECELAALFVGEGGCDTSLEGVFLRLYDLCGIGYWRG